MAGVFIDPDTHTLEETEDLERLGGPPSREIPLDGGATLYLGDGSGYFVVDGYPKPLKGRAVVLNMSGPVEVDFGQAMQVGDMLMFMGAKNIRNIEP